MPGSVLSALHGLILTIACDSREDSILGGRAKIQTRQSDIRAHAPIYSDALPSFVVTIKRLS